MYMILWWLKETNYLSFVGNKDCSIRLFKTLKEADKFANDSEYTDNMRVISIEGVK